MSGEGQKIVERLLVELGGCKYLYKSIVAGGITACIKNYGMQKPTETNDEIVDIFFKTLRKVR